MKASGKIFGRLLADCVFACGLALFTSKTFALEGLKVAVSTNTVLSWPSNTNETYLIQYRQSSDRSNSWTTLADLYPADRSTNITVFVVTNVNLWLSRSNQNLKTPYVMDSSRNSSTGISSGKGFYRVVRDGIHMIDTRTLTNKPLSGVVSIPVELANANGQIIIMSIQEDDVQVGNSILSEPISSPPTIVLDTTAMSNGVHQVSAYANFSDGNGGNWDEDSPIISITVSNEISFPNWMPFFGEMGNRMLIRATSAHANTDWHVEIYDNTEKLVRSFKGHTTNGDIYIVWDLRDEHGNLQTKSRSFTSQIATPYTHAAAKR